LSYSMQLPICSPAIDFSCPLNTICVNHNMA
jgi:hypothetical protein